MSIPCEPITCRDSEILADKELRRDLDGYVRKIRSLTPSAERTLALRALQSCRHWLGEDLARLAEPSPYPTGNDCSTIKVDPRADTAP